MNLNLFSHTHLQLEMFKVNMQSQMSQTAKHIIFAGRVQGVGFRFTAYNIANRCRLKGLVRNLSDGSVEMITQGHPEDIDDCIRDIQESFEGYISETKIEDVPVSGDYAEFKITL